VINYPGKCQSNSIYWTKSEVSNCKTAHFCKAYTAQRSIQLTWLLLGTGLRLSQWKVTRKEVGAVTKTV